MDDFPTGILKKNFEKSQGQAGLKLGSNPHLTVMKEFQKCGAIQVCQTHTLKELARSVATEAGKNRQK